MKAKEKDCQLYLLKKVHNWCKQRDMLEPEMYYQLVSSVSAAITLSSNSKITGYENT